MGSLTKSCSQGSLDQLAKIDPQTTASLLEKMKRIDFLERSLERIWQQSQFLDNRFSEQGSKTITVLELTQSYRAVTETPIKLTDPSHYYLHLIDIFREVYRCDLSCNHEIKVEIQDASSKYLNELECRIQTLKESIPKASQIRDQTHSQMSYFERLLAESPDKSGVEVLVLNNSYVAIFKDYDPAKNNDE